MGQVISAIPGFGVMSTINSSVLIAPAIGRSCRYLQISIGYFVFTILLGTTLSGCSMYRSGFNNLVVAPSQFRQHHDRCATEHFHRQIARDLLAARAAAQPDQTPSVDYAKGFEEGVVDYLTNGGPESPPLIPPRSYWKISQRHSTHNAAAQQWLAGAADGRAQAAASGQRNLALVPSSIPLDTWPMSQTYVSPEPEQLPPPIESPASPSAAF
jgi:hypothetical protein